jgi:predicted HicB family RNase H-like nuclease
MPDYQKGKIYKIVSDNIEGTYYGSTADTLWSRFGTHNSDFRAWKKGSKKYYTSYKLIEAGNASIVLVEKYPCNDKIELKARERFYIENNDCVNKCVPNRTKNEYYQDNKEKIKEYYQDNKEKIKEYYQDNKEKIKEQKKEYRKKTFICLCDGEHHNLHNNTSHFRSQYHINNLKAICDIHGIDVNDIDPKDFK